MKKYPVEIPVNLYRGTDALEKQKSRVRIDLARKIEMYINKIMDSEGASERVFSYAEIANAISSTDALVKDILFEFDGGYGGITIFKN